MSKSITLKGYFSPSGRKPEPREVTVSLNGYGMNETLSVECRGAYRTGIPYRPVERMAAGLRRESESQASVKEPYIRVEAHDGHLGKEKATVWLRSNGSFEMLTVELDGRGQISLPFGPVESLARAERRTQA